MIILLTKNSSKLVRAQGPVVVLSLKDAMEWTTVHLCGLEQMSLSPLSLRRFPITERNTHVTWKLPIRRTMVLNSSLCFHTTSTAFAYIAWSRATTVSSRPSWVTFQETSSVTYRLWTALSVKHLWAGNSQSHSEWYFLVACNGIESTPTRHSLPRVYHHCR